MNQIQKLQQWLTDYLPACKCLLDVPAKSNGKWFLDIELDGHVVTVLWQPRRNFGISSNPNSVFGEGPDEIYNDLNSVIRRILVLLMFRRQTSPPRSGRLADVRRERKITQDDLADRLDQKQASISKAENRGDDIHVRTLKKMIQALGGKLSIRAVFPDGMERELELEEV